MIPVQDHRHVTGGASSTISPRAETGPVLFQEGKHGPGSTLLTARRRLARQAGFGRGPVVLVMLVVMAIGAIFFRGSFGLGGSGGGSNGIVAGGAGDKAAASVESGIQDGTLTVEIDGDRYRVGGAELKADTIAGLAIERRLRVEIRRTESATVKARESLVEELRRRKVAHHLQ
jgi:hypothetical protein